MNGARFTAYLSDGEKKALESLAQEHGCSKNYLVRVAVRAILGLPVPRWATSLLEEALNKEAHA